MKRLPALLLALCLSLPVLAGDMESPGDTASTTNPPPTTSNVQLDPLTEAALNALNLLLSLFG